MLITKARTCKIVVFGKRFLTREEDQSAVYKNCSMSEVERLYNYTSPKEYFVTFKSKETYDNFLTKTLDIGGCKIKPVPYDCQNIEVWLHWLQEVQDYNISIY